MAAVISVWPLPSMITIIMIQMAGIQREGATVGKYRQAYTNPLCQVHPELCWLNEIQTNQMFEPAPYYSPPKPNLFRQQVLLAAHRLMVALCLLASVALYLQDSLPYKILLAALLLGYTAFLLANSHLIRLVFSLATPSNPCKYNQVYEWTTNSPGEEKREDPIKFANGHAVAAEAPGVLGRPSTSLSDHSLASNSAERTFISSSQHRAKSSQQLNESHYSQFRKLGSREVKGSSLSELAFLKEEAEEGQMERSRVKAKGIVLVQRKTAARQVLEKSKQHYDQQYCRFVREELKKEPRAIASRYGHIAKILENMVAPLLNEHRLNDEKVRQLTAEYLDVNLLSERDRQVRAEVSFQAVREGAQPRVPFQSLLHHLLLLRAGREQGREMGLALRKGKSWFELERRAGELMGARVRLGERLGAPVGRLSSHLGSGVVQFMERYNEAVGLMEQYQSVGSAGEEREEWGGEGTDSAYSALFRSRLFVLGLFVKQLNGQLKKDRVRFKDCLSHWPVEREQVGYEVVAKTAFDQLVPYFNLYKLEGDTHRKLVCEFGENNYLSVVYMLGHCLGQDRELLRWNSYVYRLVHEILS